MQRGGFDQCVIQSGISDQRISSFYFLLAARLMIIEFSTCYLINGSVAELWRNDVFHYPKFQGKSNFVLLSDEPKLFPGRDTATGQSLSRFSLDLSGRFPRLPVREAICLTGEC